jgi:hypothetical protein
MLRTASANQGQLAKLSRTQMGVPDPDEPRAHQHEAEQMKELQDGYVTVVHPRL